VKIAVTGAHGQLGGELCRQLCGDAIPLDIDTCDLTDREAVRKTLRRLQPDVVINCAAYTRVDRAEQEPELCRAVNTTSVVHLAESCGELDCPLVQISTDYVFGGGPDPGRPFREDDPPAPQGVYAQTKLEGERAAARHRKHLIVRTCGLYARPSERRAENFVKTMLRLARSGQTVRVVGDQHCTPSYVPHVARAIRFLAGTTAYGTYHVVNTGETTWYEFAKELYRRAGSAVQVDPITTAEYGALAPRPAYSVLDTGKYHALAGCAAMPWWKDALAEYLAERP